MLPQTLEDLYKKYEDDPSFFHLKRSGATRLVPGTGKFYDPDFIIIGEAPGADEDRAGVPFVGKAGEILTKLIQDIGYTRDDVWITNVVKYRPPGNRTPTKLEIIHSTPYIKQELTFLQDVDGQLAPVILLGRIALSVFFPGESIRAQHASYMHRYGKTFVPCLHPSNVVRGLHSYEYLETAFEKVRKLL